MNSYTVYEHISPSGNIYVGITKATPKRRWKYGHGYKHNKHFYNAILKYGWNNIQHKIVASNLSVEVASILEKELISLYSAENKCYNVASGGMDGNTWHKTEEEKNHLSAVLKKYFEKHKHPFCGKYHSKEAKEKMSTAGKKRWKDDYQFQYDTVIKTVKVGIFNILTGKYKEFISEKEAAKELNIKNTTFRRHVDNGSLINNYILIPIERISFEEALKKAYNRTLLNIHCGGQEKEVIQFDLKGNYIATYSSLKEAAAKTKVNISGIGNVCRKQAAQSGGFLWEYKQEHMRRH